MGLFDKKYCDVCGEKIGLFGNNKLEDANLCDKCAKKLSPWFNARRHATLEEIKQQLEFRERNRKDVEAFHTTLTFGRDSVRLMVDEDNRKFMVCNPKKEDNPDVVDLSAVTGVDLDVDEDKYEQTYHDDAKDQYVSYNPPRYEYSYNFDLTIHVNHPYFDSMKFRLNDYAVQTGTRSINDATGFTSDPVNSAASAVGSFLGALAGGMAAAQQAQPGQPGAARQTVWNMEYQQYLDMAEQIKTTLMSARNAIRQEAAAAAAPKTKMICPFCKATMIPDANGCCEYCGAAIN